MKLRGHEMESTRDGEEMQKQEAERTGGVEQSMWRKHEVERTGGGEDMSWREHDDVERT